MDTCIAMLLMGILFFLGRTLDKLNDMHKDMNTNKSVTRTDPEGRFVPEDHYP